MKDTAFITGASGFIGSHLADFLLQKGWKVICLVRPSSNLQWLKDKPVTVLSADISEREKISPLVSESTHIFHLAGVLFGKDREEYIQGNLEYTKRLLNLIKTAKPNLKRFLYVGTLASAGPSENGKLPDESDELKPITWYGESKALAENFLKENIGEIPLTVIRPPVVYGPRDYAMFELFKASRLGLNLIPGNKNKYISIIYIKDLIQGIYDACISETTIGRTYFLANEEYCPQYHLGEIIIRKMNRSPVNVVIPWIIMRAVSNLLDFFGKLFGKKVILNRQKLLEIGQNYWICSSARAKADFGFQAETKLEDGIAETLKWYKENRWL